MRSLVLLLAMAAPSAAQHHHDTAPASIAAKLGELKFPNSGNAAAQAPFLAGVKLLHNFDYPGAAEQFQAAQKADPSMALAYWGEAMTHNETLWSTQDRDAALKALAKLAPTPAARAARANTARERMFLSAVDALYGPGTKAQRDAAYQSKMAALANAFPNDVEAQVFDALAILGLTNGTRDAANYARAAAKLEKLFPTHQSHPGVVHYLIHAYDDPANAAKGLPMAKLYDKIAPDSPHAQHMTSHIFLALGMWPDVEAANLRASEAAMRNWGAPKAAMACGHGGIWLAYARLQQGKDVMPQLLECRGFADQQLDAAAKEGKPLPAGGALEGAAASTSTIRVMRGVETGDWAGRQAIPDGVIHMARFIDDYGDVLAARRDPARSRAALASLDRSLAILRTALPREAPDDDVTMPWLALIRDEAEAVTLLAEGRRADGMAVLRSVTAREKAIPPVFGPPLLLKPSWELLGDELLAVGDKAGAAAAYRESLALQPGRRLSVAGLSKATG